MKPIEVFKSYIPYYKRNLKVALPVMLSQLCVGIVQLVDSIMVGHLGTVELAAVAFASSVFAIGNCFAMGVLFGLTPLVGQAYVREQHDVCSRLFQNAFLLALISMVLVCVLLLAAMWLMPFMGQDAQVVELAQPYFLTLILSMIPQLLFLTFKQFYEGLGDTKTAMWITIVTIFVNVFFNYVLIFGKWGFPFWGVFGAGVATLIARLISPVIFLVAMRCRKQWWGYMKAFRWSRFSWKELRNLLHLGLPISGQLLLEVTSFSLMGIMVGWLGAVPLAANQVAINLSNMSFMVVLGIGSATTIRVSHQIGARDYKAMTMAASASVHLAIFFEVITALLFIFFGRAMMTIFTTDPEVIELGAKICIFVGLFQIFDGLQAVGIGILRGLTDVRVIMRNAFIAYIVICLPLAYLFTFTLGMGAPGVWAACIVGIGTAAILYHARYHKIRRQKFDELQ
jgi:multidrug resistance protein, MATE family